MKSKFSSVILGCMDWGSWRRSFSASEMADLMQHGLSEGLSTFDHADIYGDYSVEAQFGEAFAQSKIDRSAIQIITKCGIQYPCQSRPHSGICQGILQRQDVCLLEDLLEGAGDVDVDFVARDRGPSAEPARGPSRSSCVCPPNLDLGLGC